MHGLAKLKSVVREGLLILGKDKSLIEGTVYASANRRVVGRLVYTHHFPCQGLQEPKSDDDFGLSVQGYFNRNGKKVVGFGHVANDVSTEAVRRALERARVNAIHDPDFHGFPDLVKEKSKKGASADPRLLTLTPEKEATLLADISFKTLEGALAEFQRYHKKESAIGDPDFIVSGDNFLITERMALASTKGITVSDESTVVMSLLSAMVERAHSKGRGWGAGNSLKSFDPAAAGTEAAGGAIRGIGGKEIETGNYNIIFGPQAVNEIFSNLLLPSLSASMLDFRVSIFNGKLGAEIASPLLTMYDDATHPMGAASKAFSDDGYPTARVPLIENGRFAGFLTSDYYRKKLLAESDAELKEKLGPYGREWLHYNHIPRSGFRFGGGGGRMSSHEPSISATNLFISSAKPVSRTELLEKVKNGVYIGALWYTYPIAGYKAGEISGTAVADTFRIRNGKIAEPVRVNAIRIRANLRDIVKNIIGITVNPRPTILWASDEVTYAPEIGIRDIHLEAIRHDEA